MSASFFRNLEIGLIGWNDVGKPGTVRANNKIFAYYEITFAFGSVKHRGLFSRKPPPGPPQKLLINFIRLRVRHESRIMTDCPRFYSSNDQFSICNPGILEKCLSLLVTSV